MIFAKLLIGFGLGCLLFSAFFFWETHNPQRLSFAVDDYPSKFISTDGASLPEEIIIAAINLDLPIIPAKLDRGKWEATTKGVSYLISSPIPGEKGNSILYGHNWQNLLGNIVKLKPGQIITIKYRNGSLKNFRIDSTVLVSPKEVAILAASETPQITIYTCIGFLDSKRFVVVAKIKE